MKLQILVLCHANLVRSPFIEGYFKYLYKNSRIKDKIKIEFRSSGTEGRPNLLPDARVVAKANSLGFDISDHRSSHASFDLLSQADLIFVTDSRQYSRFENYLTDLLPRTYLLTSFGLDSSKDVNDIKDPTKCKDDESFLKIIDFAADETKRVWTYIESQLAETLASGKKINADIFEKDIQIKKKNRYGNYFSKRFTEMCPNCQSRRLRRIKRKGYMQIKIYPKFHGYPYHCGNCKKDSVLFIGSNAFLNTDNKMKKAWKKFIDEDCV